MRGSNRGLAQSQFKTQKVIVIQDKRTDVEQRQAVPIEVQEGFVRHAFGQNRIKGNQESHPEPTDSKANVAEIQRERNPDQLLGPGQLQFLLGSLFTMRAEVSRLSAQLQGFHQRISKLEKGNVQESSVPRKKPRRRADEIVKNFHCPHEACSKAYGSEVSLNLHIRLKHANPQSDSRVSFNSGESSNRVPLPADLMREAVDEHASEDESLSQAEESK